MTSFFLNNLRLGGIDLYERDWSCGESGGMKSGSGPTDKLHQNLEVDKNLEGLALKGCNPIPGSTLGHGNERQGALQNSGPGRYGL